MAPVKPQSNAHPPTSPAIVFDLGGVLLDWNPRHLYRKLFPGDEQGMERFLGEIGFDEWNHLQDAGRPFPLAVADLCARFPQHCALIRAYDERYPESLNGPILACVDILARLRQAGWPLYALSNWPAEKFRLVRSDYPFLDWFDSLVISGEVGLAKPDPRIFHLLLERVGRPAAKCLLIDDAPRNITAAQALGMDIILFQSPARLETELTRRGIL